MGKYDDIINLAHHVSRFHRPMSMENRAAQFAPFAALNGHDEAIAETARRPEEKIELSDDEKNLISRKLIDAIERKARVSIIYFVPDKSKAGGSYRSITGTIKKWDDYEQILIFDNGNTVSIESISEIETDTGL